MAVIVQRMVAAEAAGVIFTADVTRGRSDRLLIEASAGLGEGVASGRVRPDRFVLAKRRSRILERSVASAGAPASMTPPVAGSAAWRWGSSGRSGRAAAGHEWAVAGRAAHILQARPMTGAMGAATPAPAARQVWTNANTRRDRTDVPTPIAWSVLKPGVMTLLVRVMLGSFGLSLGDLPVLSVIGGRAYFNVNTFVGCLRRLPSFRSRDMTEVFGGHQPGHEEAQQILLSPEAIPRPDFSWIEFLLRLPGFIAAFLSLTADRASAAIKAVRAEHEELRRIDLARLSDAELVRLARRLAARLFDRHELLVTVGVSGVYSMAFLNACEAWLGAEGREGAMRLLRGIGGSAGMRKRATRSGASRRSRASTRGRAEHRRGEAVGCGAARLRASEGRGGIPRRVGSVHGGARPPCARRGRALQRAVVGEPRLHPGHGAELPEGPRRHRPGPRARRLAAERAELAKQLRGRLRNPLKRLAFDIALKRSQYGLRLRENLKSEVVRRLALCRRALLELGGRLAGRGVLRERDDIFS